MSFQKRFEQFCSLVLLIIGIRANAFAQYNHPPELAGPGSSTLNAELVKTGLYVFSGGGGNAVLRLSGNGFILVNAGLPSGREALLRKVRRICDQPIRALILTDNDPSRAGTIDKFLQSGTRIIAQQNAAAKMVGSTVPELTTPRLITYDHDYTLRMGGVEAQLLHFGSARTNGDTVVYFPNVKAIAAGALVGPDAAPNFSLGGSLIGWQDALDQILKLDFDVAIPSSGPVQKRAEVEAFKAKIDALVTRAAVKASR